MCFSRIGGECLEKVETVTFAQKTIYQIYIKSFQDSNGDGIGDLRGIIQRLDYLQDLGIECVWITLFFVSPQNDNGYDVADYLNIHPVYGTMQDFEELIDQANMRDIDIMLDMVFNHTSTEHEWFQKALSGDSKYKDYYIWKSARSDGSLPTNWESKFGGSAWEYIESFDEYYLHLFDRTQADVNWENPSVREEYRNILDFWLAKGVRGFRFDVVNLISKPTLLEDDHEGDGRHMYTDGPNVHTYLKELCAQLQRPDVLTVGEMSSTSLEHCIQYTNPAQKQLDMCFNVHHLKVDYGQNDKWQLVSCDFDELKRLLFTWQTGLKHGGGWGSCFGRIMINRVLFHVLAMIKPCMLNLQKCLQRLCIFCVELPIFIRVKKSV